MPRQHASRGYEPVEVAGLDGREKLLTPAPFRARTRHVYVLAADRLRTRIGDESALCEPETPPLLDVQLTS